ncbi:hypothetical protein BGZ80_002931 [Entomortierella chlamydospora]|uniref:Mediator of RNA polymerase II transcription subunit 8 n=1 Tax=Entomortierella chlamydospora TaxID=101097 RepID=A0A9P6N2D5_9FUNG|nr:hypothetical protein BGZ79_003658 [Entomortierella chlamydospora]KAG0021169.1 hypothetical protein BGZ80_002931 [Entomortierella chlamydospora]
MNTTFPQTEINVEALENVKTRLFQLQESIVFFLRSINPDIIPGTVSWTELHSKFNVLIAKYLHLTNLVNDPHNTLLQSYTVFPNEAPANDQHVQNLSVLLRTKLFPELEQEAEDRISDGSIPGLVNSSGSAAEDRRILQALKLKVTMHDALCQAADEILENQRDMVHVKMRYESDDEDEDDDNDGDEPGEATATEDGENTKTQSKAQPSSNSNSKSKQYSNDVIPVDDFAIGNLDSASSVRYMSDWGGALHDMDGYSSGSDGCIDADELDDSYFEAQRQVIDSDEASDEDDMESIQSEEDIEAEADEESGDVFIEVGAESQDVRAGSSAMTTTEDTFEEEFSDEEDMEEVM